MFKKKEILTVPNLISLIRVLLIPLIIVFFLVVKSPILTAVAIVVSGLTDISDGWVARKFNKVTDFGKFFDAVADKLTEATVIVLLVPAHPFFLATLIMLLLREGLMLMYGFIILKTTETVKSAKWYGKISTLVVYIIMVAMVLFESMPKALEYSLIIISCAVLLASMILYIVYYQKMLKNEENKKHEFHINYFKYIGFLVWLIIIVVALLMIKDVSLTEIINYTPPKKWLAILVILVLFALKSLTFVIHIDILYIACGMLFDLPTAICVDVVGTIITFIIPYFIGKFQGSNMINKLIATYPRVEKLSNARKKHDFLFSFIARLIGGIPYDILSLLMGSLSVNFLNYLISGIIAISPDIILSQMMGQAINDPTSPGFIISICIKVFKIVVSVIIVRLLTKKRRSPEEIRTEPNELVQNDLSENETQEKEINA